MNLPHAIRFPGTLAVLLAALSAAASAARAHHSGPQAPSQGIGYLPTSVARPEPAAEQPVADTIRRRPEGHGTETRDARSAPLPSTPR